MSHVSLPGTAKEGPRVTSAQTAIGSKAVCRGYDFTALQDLVLALRSTRRRPLAFAMAAVVLGLGIGVLTSVFSLVNVLLIRPLSYPDADRLVQFRLDYQTGSQFRASDRHYAHWSQTTGIFESLTAYLGPIGTHIEGDSEPLSVRGSQVSPEFFQTFGMEITHGRGFSDEVSTPVPTEVVLSLGLWRTAFGSDPSVIGRPITLDGHSVTVVGVSAAAPPAPFDADLWTPLHLVESHRGYLLRVTGRLRQGIGLEQATAAMEVVHRSLELAASEVQGSLSLHPLQTYLYGDRRPTLLLLLAASLIVFLLTCANVANLRLSAVTSRGRSQSPYQPRTSRRCSGVESRKVTSLT